MKGLDMARLDKTQEKLKRVSLYVDGKDWNKIEAYSQSKDIKIQEGFRELLSKWVQELPEVAIDKSIKTDTVNKSNSMFPDINNDLFKPV
jgi:hypothetical protein